MSHFQLEQQLQAALRLDTSINVGSMRNCYGSKENDKTPTRRARSTGRLNSSSLLNGSLNRSRTLGLQGPPQPGLKRSTSSGRLASPGRNGARNRTPSAGRTAGGDRFIPNRSTTDLEMAHHSLVNNTDSTDTNTEDFSEHQKRQTLEILNGNSQKDSRILSFKAKAPAADEAHANSLKVLYSTGKPKAPNAAKTRQVPSKPERILDAPDLRDDFYLHLLDWSKNNHMAVALHDTLFIWNAADGSIEELYSKQSEEEYISCVSWVTEGNYLAVGDSTALVDLYDVSCMKMMRSMQGHSDRVSTLKWNSHILASGSRKGDLFLHDVRIADHLVARLEGHTQEICGMAWSPEFSSHLLATGANDNLVNIWDDRNTAAPIHTFSEHIGAIKAMAFCPWQPRTLATGGGTLDRCIRFWNLSTGNMVNCIDTGSQVSAIVWSSEDYKELASGHGYSHNQVTVWKYPSMGKVADLQAHTSRVLSLLLSPDGSTVASAAGDETIKMWKLWPVKDKKLSTAAKKSKQPVSLFNRGIR